VSWDEGPCGCGFPRGIKNTSGVVLVNRAEQLVADGAVEVQPLEETVDA
jgi:hypothetical protein